MATVDCPRAVCLALAAAATFVLVACQSDRETTLFDAAAVIAEVEAAVWTFHAADTARDAEAVIGLLWPEYDMLVDGQRLDYDQIVSSARGSMPNLALFHTVWSDLRVIPVGPDAGISSFLFRDSILARDGNVTRAQGSTTFLWERRGNEWRLRFGHADHYPITP